jgi:hypothetical protein
MDEKFDLYRLPVRQLGRPVAADSSDQRPADAA